MAKCQSITCLPLSTSCRKESGTDPTWTCQLVLPGFFSGASHHVIPNMCSQPVEVVTLSVPTHGDPCTTQQFRKSSSTTLEMHHILCTKLAYQSTAVCVTLCRIALQAWLLNQDTPIYPLLCFPQLSFSPVSTGCQVFPAPSLSVQWSPWSHWVLTGLYGLTPSHSPM